MRVCMILEGCYPYTRGGVSTWAHQYISSSPDTEFVLWTILANHEMEQKFVYDLPKNVVEVKEVFLEDSYLGSKQLFHKWKKKEYADLIHLLGRILDEKDNGWEEIITRVHNSECGVYDVASSQDFLDYAMEFAADRDIRMPLSDTFYGLRSILIPVLHLLKQEIPAADIYHATAAGYSGVLVSLAGVITGHPTVITEHGIYPREREEELMQAEWISDSLRDVWIRFFYNLSRCAYDTCSRVTSLFRGAMARQIQIGCDSGKTVVIPNGIQLNRFEGIPPRKRDDTVNIGAFVRFAAIKDLKTLIRAYYALTLRVPNTRLYILGGTDEPEYEVECRGIIEQLGLTTISIEGFVDTVEYLKKMDFTMLTSISEGQPLAVLESLAAGRPCVTTNVGCCKELLEEAGDEFGVAGIVKNPMDAEGLADAMEIFCSDKDKCETYGRNGMARVFKYFTHELMMSRYFDLYKEVL